MVAPAMGKQAKMAFDTALPFDTSSIPLEFESETLSKQGVILQSDGIRGTRQNASERTRTGPYKVSGQITFLVSRVLLDNLLPLIMGAAENANVFAFGEAPGSGYLLIDRVTKRFTYSGVVVNRATFRAAKNDFLRVVLDVEAETESVSDDAFPVLTMPTEKPYVFTDGVLTLQSSARGMSSVELVVDNSLDTERFVNELTRSEIPAQDHIVTLRSTHPYDTDNDDLYGQALAGAAATLVFTNAEEASSVLTFSMATVQYPDRSPNVGGPGEIMLNLEGTARKSGSTNALSITNAHS